VGPGFQPAAGFLEVDEKGLAADERRLTQIENQKLIRVHPCSSAANIGFFSILFLAGILSDCRKTPVMSRTRGRVPEAEAAMPDGPPPC
jgi:hypothetical protein